MSEIFLDPSRSIKQAYYSLAGSVTFQTESRRISRTIIAPSAKLGSPIPNEKSMLVGITIVIAAQLYGFLLRCIAAVRPAEHGANRGQLGSDACELLFDALLP